MSFSGRLQDRLSGTKTHQLHLKDPLLDRPITNGTGEYLLKGSW